MIHYYCIAMGGKSILIGRAARTSRESPLPQVTVMSLITEASGHNGTVVMKVPWTTTTDLAGRAAALLHPSLPSQLPSS